MDCGGIEAGFVQVRVRDCEGIQNDGWAARGVASCRTLSGNDVPLADHGYGHDTVAIEGIAPDFSADNKSDCGQCF
jgi:hypothetical protein